MSIRADNLTFSYRHEIVLKGISFFVPDQTVLCILGPNGVGKSTLLKLLTGSLKAKSGLIELDGKNIADYRISTLAAHAAYIPQTSVPDFNYTVSEYVLMGQNRHIGLFAAPGKAKRREVSELLCSLGIGHLCDSGIRQISGGEFQLVKIARALIQKSGTIFMDEPCAGLDPGNAELVLNLIRLLQKRGFGIVFTSHDPNHALACASQVLTMQDGCVSSFGVPEAVITTKNMSALYHATVDVTQALVGGKVKSVCTILGGQHE